MKTILTFICLVLALTFSSASGALVEESHLDSIDVYLVPLNDFPEQLSSDIATTLSKGLGIRVKSSLRLGELGLSPIAGINQYAAEDILAISQNVIKSLPETSAKTYFVILTTKDINNRSGNFRYQFSFHDTSLNTSVISLARMIEVSDDKTVNEALALSRFIKMLLRAIGEMHLGWKRSIDPTDIMYSPIMGLPDLDRLQFNHKSEPGKKSSDQQSNAKESAL